jgi:hypothetical protein
MSTTVWMEWQQEQRPQQQLELKKR